MDKGLISDLLKTPSQIRKENDQRRLTEGLAMAQLAQQGNTLGGVGGMFANFGAQQAAQTGRNISNAFRGVTDAIGTATGADLRPADERAAGQAQALARSIDMKDPASIRAGADKMRQFNPKAAEALEGRATALEAKLAEAATAAEQTSYERTQDAIENADRALNTAIRMNDSQSVIAMRKAELAVLTATTPDQIAKAKADLETARAQLELINAQTATENAELETAPTASSAFGKQLSDEGLEYGTPEFNTRMASYNTAKQEAIGLQKVVTGMSEFQQVTTIRGFVQDNPSYKTAAERQEKINLATENLQSDEFRSNSELQRATERTVSEIYNSDSRAQTEIDRFLTGKGIPRGLADWITTTVGGTMTKATQENLQEVVKIAQKAVDRQINDVVTDIEGAYSSVEGLSQDNVSKALSSYRKGSPTLETGTTSSGTSYTVTGD